MSSIQISIGNTAFIKAQPQEVIEQQKIASQSSITTMLTDVPPTTPSYIQQPGVKHWTPEEILSMSDVMGKNHLRPMSDSEYKYFINILKSKGMTTDKFYYDYELYAIAATVHTNFKKFYYDKEIDPIVEETIYDIKLMPAASAPNFSLAMEHYMSEKWFGQNITDSANKYSLEEKIRLGANNIAFVEEYLTDKNSKAQSQAIIDATEDERRELAATEAGSAVALSLQAPTVSEMIKKAEAVAPKTGFMNKIFKPAEPLTYEQAVHPMLRYGHVKRK